MRRAVCPGSFDPVTMGHLDVFGRAADMYDEVIVAVLTNSQKVSLFSLEERISLVSEATSEWPNVHVETFRDREMQGNYQGRW